MEIGQIAGPRRGEVGSGDVSVVLVKMRITHLETLAVGACTEAKKEITAEVQDRRSQCKARMGGTREVTYVRANQVERQQREYPTN
jgi:hypothetical protein